jgi:hypothetical protein
MEQTASFGGGTDGWIFKVNTSGEIVWQKRVGGGGFDEISSAQQTPDGGFVIAGETRSFGASIEDFWVVKFDSAGDIDWQKRYGGSKIEEAESIALTPDGGYVVAGITRTFGEGLRDMWLIKLDANGDLAGCGPEVNAVSTTAFSKITTSASTDAGANSVSTTANVKDSAAIVEETDVEISTQCASE